MNPAKHVVGPDGQLVQLAQGAVIKPGWREATAEDHAAKVKLEADRQDAESRAATGAADIPPHLQPAPKAKADSKSHA